MADEPELPLGTGEATQTEATEKVTDQATEAPTQKTEPETPAQETPEEIVARLQKEIDWRDKELNRKHGKNKEFERENERIKKERDDALALAQARVDGKETPALTTQQPALSEEEVNRRARALRDGERYQEQLTSTNSSGETTYGDKWGKALDKLSTFGTIDPADMTAILNTDNPAKVLFEFGTNPAEYQRIMDLPPAKRLFEIVKISMKETPKPKPNISNAPAPTESVGNRVNPEVDLRSEKVADADWYAVRKKQKEERFKEQRALGRR